jgi:histidinol phosphatase-like PHP family hydrolase
MNPAPLDVLVLADLHYTALARHSCRRSDRQAPLAHVLARKALARLRQKGIEPQLILLLGDLVDNGEAAGAELDLARLAGDLLGTGIRVLAVPGNHDGDPERYVRLFDSAPGLHLVNGYGFLLFSDRRSKGEHYARPDETLTWPAQAAAQHPDLPLIAVQHNPLHPVIRAEYPYMLDNNAAVLAGYREARVLLSLSGHYHPGQPAHEHAGVIYNSVPALTEAPYAFQHVRLADGQAAVTTHTLQLEVPGLCDVHCHTEFAYCATTVTAGWNRLLADRLGLAKLCLTEHAFHLYFPKEVAWTYNWQRDRSLADAVWNHDPRRGRMAAYRAFADAQRGPNVRLGLEVDLMAGGELLLHPDDAAGWDLLIGAIHEIDVVRQDQTPPSDLEWLFIRDLERLLTFPIQVLAHPFRIFTRHKMEKPAHLYRAVAGKLAAAGIAAEINFHTNQPEPAFIRACLDAGTRIALGSDAHRLDEVGEFDPHLRILRDVGLEPDDLVRYLYAPA